jgi:hypothetical protein
MTLVSSKTLGNGGRFPSRDNQHGQYLRIPQTYPETYYLLGTTKTAPKWQERQMLDDLPERILEEIKTISQPYVRPRCRTDLARHRKDADMPLSASPVPNRRRNASGDRYDALQSFESHFEGGSRGKLAGAATILLHPAPKCSSSNRPCRPCSKLAANSQNTLELKTEEWVSG